LIIAFALSKIYDLTNHYSLDFFLGYDEAGVIPGQKKDVFTKEEGFDVSFDD
jgi:hypothetical protein